MRYRSDIRKLSIVRTLATGMQYDPAVLASAHGVSLKTIRRDIEALGTAGFPIFLVHNEDTPHLRSMVFMDKDWISHCPGPPELPSGRILDASDAMDNMNGVRSSAMGATVVSRQRAALASEVATLRHTLITHGIQETVKPPPETRHFLCGCGHHIEKQGVNGTSQVIGGKPGCPSCGSWIRNLESGIL